MARPCIAFADTVRQRQWLAAKISAPFHTPVEPPVITGRPKPPPPKPPLTIIDLIDALDARPAEAAPMPPEFTPEELAEIENYVARKIYLGPRWRRGRATLEGLGSGRAGGRALDPAPAGRGRGCRR